MEKKCIYCKHTGIYSSDQICRSCREYDRFEPIEVSTSNIQYATVGSYFVRTNPDYNRLPDIKNVIFNDPATIVFWSDGTKTVVKTQDGEPYDAEKGLAMAISKKALGNQGNYCNVFKKWLPEEEEDDSKEVELVFDGGALARECKKAMETIVKSGSNFSAKKGV